MSITLKTPSNPKGYASTDTGLGQLYHLAVSSTKTTHLSNLAFSQKSGTIDRKKEVARINSAYNSARESIAQDILRYLIKNDGVVDAWPDPDTGLSIGFQLEEDYDEDEYTSRRKTSYDTYSYEFNYFASDYQSSDTGLITGGKRAYRNEYKYKDTQRLISIRNHESYMLEDFKENNPLKFGYSLLVIFMIFLCFGGPLLSTGYLYALQRARDPEVVELAVEAFGSKFDWIYTVLGAMPKVLQYIMIIILFIPFALVMLLKLIPEFVCFIAGKSTLVLIIYGLMLFSAGFMAFGMLYAFVGEDIPKAKPIFGLQCLMGYFQSKNSKERKEAVEENERLKKEYTELMEDFHSAWYSYVSKQR